MRLKVDYVGDGLHPNEAVVAINTAEGVERILVHRRSLADDSISVGWPINERGNLVLVELPRETQSGAWRVWVDEGQLVEDEKMRA